MHDYISQEVNGLMVPAQEEKAWRQALDQLMVDWGKRVGLAIEAEKTKNRFPSEVFISLFED